MITKMIQSWNHKEMALMPSKHRFKIQKMKVVKLFSIIFPNANGFEMECYATH